VSHPVECAACHKPIRSSAALTRRIGSRCWRKLRPDQRAALTALTRRSRSLGPAEVRAALNRPAPSAPGQLPLSSEEH
jgi:hypothetical protein